MCSKQRVETAVVQHVSVEERKRVGAVVFYSCELWRKDRKEKRIRQRENMSVRQSHFFFCVPAHKHMFKSASCPTNKTVNQTNSAGHSLSPCCRVRDASGQLDLCLCFMTEGGPVPEAAVLLSCVWVSSLTWDKIPKNRARCRVKTTYTEEQTHFLRTVKCEIYFVQRKSIYTLKYTLQMDGFCQIYVEISWVRADSNE